MHGLTDFRIFQLGREVKNGGAAGSAVAATVLWRGQASGKDDTKVKRVKENLGFLMGTNRTLITSVAASAKQGPDPATFEQLPYLLASGVRGIERGTQDGAGSGYIYNYLFPTNKASVEMTGTTIAFVSATKKITDSGNGLAFVKKGDLIQVSGSASNNGIYIVAAGGVAGELTTVEALVDEAATASVTIEILTQAYTLEGGNNAGCEEAAYGKVVSFELSGKGGTDADVVLAGSSWIARQWAPSTFTAGISVPAVTSLLYSGTRLYLDASGGAFGGTEVTGTMLDFALKCNTGIRACFNGSGNLFYTRAERTARPTLTLDLSLLYNAATIAEIAAWRNQDIRWLQLKNLGPALTTPGTTYSNKALIANLPGKWDSFSGLEGAEIGDTVKGTFTAEYDPTVGAGPNIIVVNELSALP